ncbi:hypothetical protein F7725_020238 [Dissostichus mawsoni]|uniref:Uncharacterized protein n=1 Tax=Dissostichus mawsoni TaxID=36200 RepID=A0A7J5YCQ7_DISMA|nr:hypothetical protein F7725_020238 [Dissostichus mawsoni]
MTYFKKTKERERDYGLALANNSSEENRDRDSSSGVSSEETMREDEDETQVQVTWLVHYTIPQRHLLECRHQGRADVIRYINRESHLKNNWTGIGLTTKSTLIRLHEAGEIPSGDVTRFYKAARGFLLRSKEYALKKLPLNDPLLPHAEFVDFRQ